MKAIEVKNITKVFGDFTALDHINLSVPAGKFVTLLGPSGCGKTTLLRTIAGFLEPEEGNVYFDDKDMTFVPANKRNTAMCFQSYALFPHKNVYENIRFGLRMHKVPEAEQKGIIENALDIVNLRGLEHRKPYELSGGQQQRVALARCIVVRPDVLLFDEPLSNLDAKLRESVRVEIRNLQKSLGITTIYVTHDQAEALAISDLIVSMSAGHIQQVADPRTIYEKPINRYVADFIGTANIVNCTGKPEKVADGFRFDTEIGLSMVAGSTCNYTDDDQDYSLCWRPEDMYLLKDGECPDKMNIIRAHVLYTVYMGNTMDVFLQVGDKQFRTNVTKTVSLEENTDVTFGIPFELTHLLRG